MAEDLVMTDRMQGVDCYWCEDGTPHRHERPESAVAGSVDIAAFRAWWDANMEPDRPSVAYWLVRETAQKAYAAGLAASNARAERLAAALRGHMNRWHYIASHVGKPDDCPISACKDARAVLAALEKGASGG